MATMAAAAFVPAKLSGIATSFTGLRPVRLAAAAAAPATSSSGARVAYRPLKVVAVDYPRPDIDSSTNFLEAAALSAYMRDASRPAKPLKVVIAGAGTAPLFFCEMAHLFVAVD